tara:strand:- start:353 stop:1042 length:690 start_codon:yes stop_codon:yes gene_type:complete
MDSFLNLIIGFALGGVGAYLFSYLKSKGKYKALFEDNLRLETEKQDLESFYKKELEKLKLVHALEIQKEGVQLSTKREEYSKFMNLLTEIQTTTYERIVGKLAPAIAEYQECLNQGTSEEIDAKQTEIKGIVNQIILETGKPSLKLYSETNSIKLICTEKINNLIQQFLKLLDSNLIATNELIAHLASNEYRKNPDLPSHLVSKFHPDNNHLEKVKDALLEEMKQDFTG